MARKVFTTQSYKARNKNLNDIVDRSKQAAAAKPNKKEAEARLESLQSYKALKQLQDEVKNVEEEILQNSKLITSEKFKELDFSKQIAEAEEAILDNVIEARKETKAGNVLRAQELKTRRDILRTQKDALKENQEAAKAQIVQNKLIKERLEKINKLADVVKSPLKSLEHFGEHLTTKFSKNFSLAIADSNKSVMNLVKNGLQFGLISALMLGVHRALHLNEEIVELQRNLGVSAHEAHGIHGALESAVISSRVLGATQKDYADAFTALKEDYGTAVATNTKLLDSQVLLTKQIGLSSSEATSFNNIAQASGTTAEENLKHIRDTVTEYNQMTGDSMDVREVQRDIAKTSLKTLATYRGNVKELARAVIQAKRLGMSVEDISKSTDGLLDIESSLENEMKARVLTGKSLNFDKARALKLAGKETEAMEEMVRQAGSYNEFLDMAPMQQKAMAEAMGMNVEQLTKTLQLREKDRLTQKKRMSDLSEADKKKLIDAKVYTAEQIKQATMDEQSATAKEKLAQISHKLLMIFDKMISGPLNTMIEKFTLAVDYVDSLIVKFKEMVPPEMKGPLKAVGAITAGVAGIFGAFKLFSGIKSFFTRGTKDNPMHVEGGGGGGEGSGSGEEEEDTGSRIKRGLKGAKRLVKAFKKGGFKGGMKEAGRMIKRAYGGGGASAGGGPSGGGGGASSGGATKSASGAAPKKGFFGKIGSFFGKVGEKIGNLGPMKYIKKLFSDKGLLKKLFKYLPKMGTIINMVSTIASLRSGASGAGQEGGPTNKDVGNEVVKTIGDLGGSALGGIVGSLIPGAGNILGSILGGMGGSALAGLITKNVDTTDLGKSTVEVLKPEGAIKAADALIRPGQPPILFDKGDLIAAGPNIGGIGEAKGNGGNGGGEVVTLLRELIAKVDQPTVLQFGSKTVETFEKQSNLRKSFTSQIDRGYGATS
jgi:hypothetical protein